MESKVKDLSTELTRLDLVDITCHWKNVQADPKEI